MYKGVFWLPVFRNCSVSQANMERKQNDQPWRAQSNPVPEAREVSVLYWLQCYLDYTSFISLFIHGRIAMFTEGKTLKRLNQREVPSPTNRHFHIKQEWKPRGMKFGRLGTAKIKHKHGVEGLCIVLSEQHKPNSISASVWIMCCQKGKASPSRRREGEREEIAALRVFLCCENTWKNLTFGLLNIHNLKSGGPSSHLIF